MLSYVWLLQNRGGILWAACQAPLLPSHLRYQRHDYPNSSQSGSSEDTCGWGQRRQVPGYQPVYEPRPVPVSSYHPRLFPPRPCRGARPSEGLVHRARCGVLIVVRAALGGPNQDALLLRRGRCCTRPPVWACNLHIVIPQRSSQTLNPLL